MLLVSCRSCSENRDVNKGQFHSLPTLLNKSLTLRSSIPLGAGEEILGLSKFGSHGTPPGRYSRAIPYAHPTPFSYNRNSHMHALPYEIGIKGYLSLQDIRVYSCYKGRGVCKKPPNLFGKEIN